MFLLKLQLLFIGYAALKSNAIHLNFSCITEDGGLFRLF